MNYNGEYGGKVLRPFKGMGTQFIRGAILPAEFVETWPLANRQALHINNNVEWFGPPNPEESEARESGAEIQTPAPKAQTQKPPKEDKPKPASQPKGGKRSNRTK